MAENNDSNVSSYISGIKDWKIQEIISGYINAFLIFSKCLKSNRSRQQITFSNLRKMCDILYETKENFHLIYKRVLNPQKQIFEAVDKITPNEREINFMNNIGLLFHRVLVTRELKYLIDYYEKDSEFYQESKKSYNTNIRKITELFDQGADLLIQLLTDHQENINLISYFIDNREEILPIFKEKYDAIIIKLTGEDKTANPYLMAAEYYVDSGWNEKALEVLKEFLQINPRNERAVQLIKRINKTLV
ncbi:hypothetical protein H8E88_05015 [candidate division KSB1 bacterium]|nr:hypothetical protein [candidate division KSB1 bacterium]MBL7092568.1 hypothetical protein [candidate division KSB1 bacterium]